MLKDDKWFVVGVDIEEKFRLPNNENNTFICADILTLTPKDFEQWNFDLIWASPPCVAFSMASVSHYWDTYLRYIPKAKKTIHNLQLVYQALWLIYELRPKFWFLENPKAMLHKFIGEPNGWVTYCQYGEKRMKPTNLWGIHPKSFEYKHCHYGAKCHVSAPRGSKTGTQGKKSAAERSKIPYLLSLAIKESVEREL